jgi:hypothetical protein
VTSETAVAKEVLLALAQRFKACLFRTNSGKAWLSGGGKVQVDNRGTAHVPFARPVGLGLALTNGDTVPGLADYTGWTSKLVTKDMVGRTVAIYTEIETKESKGGARMKHQREHLQRVRDAGGIAGFASSVPQAIEIFETWKAGGQQPLL